LQILPGPVPGAKILNPLGPWASLLAGPDRVEWTLFTDEALLWQAQWVTQTRYFSHRLGFSGRTRETNG
jgi:hypothetical protein